MRRKSSRAAKKTSFLLDATSEAILGARDRAPGAERAHGQRSIIVREILRRYDEICRDEMPELSAEEWKLVRSIGRDLEGSESAGSVTVLVATMLRMFGRKPEGETLIQKVLGLRTSQQVALLDAVERYWASVARGEEPDAVPKSIRSSKT